jgi:hypothetical protein
VIYLSTEITIGDSYVNESVYFSYQECDKLFGGDSIIKELRNRPNGIPIRMSQTFDLDEPWGDDRLEEHMEKIDYDLDILSKCSYPYLIKKSEFLNFNKLQSQKLT